MGIKIYTFTSRAHLKRPGNIHLFTDAKKTAIPFTDWLKLSHWQGGMATAGYMGYAFPTCPTMSAIVNSVDVSVTDSP